jgi:hypothetical protein
VSNQNQPHDDGVATVRLKRWAAGRKGQDDMTVNQGLILPGERKMAEIWIHFGIRMVIKTSISFFLSDEAGVSRNFVSGKHTMAIL